jgi:hypothetical protein
MSPHSFAGSSRRLLPFLHFWRDVADFTSGPSESIPGVPGTLLIAFDFVSAGYEPQCPEDF